jgi:hypothetical protein
MYRRRSYVDRQTRVAPGRGVGIAVQRLDVTLGVCDPHALARVSAAGFAGAAADVRAALDAGVVSA